MLTQTVTINQNSTPNIIIGRRSTYETQQVIFDVSWLIKTYGEGTAELLIKRPKDASAYPVVATLDGNTLTWTVSETDTQDKGHGECEIYWYVNGGLAKSCICGITILRDIGDTTETAPDPYETWVDELARLGAETLTNAQAAEQSANNAAKSASEADNSAAAALKSEENALNSENAAKASEQAAAASEQGAEQSATEAAQSASAAESSANDAQESADNASASADRAEQAAASIDGDTERAEAAAQTAQGAASDASRLAGTASTKATEAAGSAATAEQAAATATQKATDASASATSAAGSASSASASATAAGNAQTAAETAQGKAEDAQEAAETAAQSIEDSAAQIDQNAEDILNLKSALTTVGGINSFAVDSYSPTWNLWDGSWGLSNTNPVTGSTRSYMVHSPVIPVTAGQYYSIGVLDNPIYSTKCKVIGVSWGKSDGTIISTTNVYPQGGYLKWVQAPATAEKAYMYFNSNNASVALAPTDIYSNHFKAFFANRLVNFTNRDSAGQYAIKENEWLPSYLLEEEAIERVITHTVSVGSTNSMYTSLRAALDDIATYGHASETNRFEVLIKEGTYDIASYYTAAEKAAPSFVGLTVPDWVTLKGVGNREKTILKYELEEASNNICVLNLKNTCSLENLTLYGVKTRYCVHDDKANYLGTPYKRFCKNVHFKGDTMTLGAVYGAGINSNAEWTFEDCIFESLTQKGYQNCFSVHGSGQAVQVGSSSVTFNNCRFIGYGTNNSVILSTLMNNASYFQNYCKFMGCSANGRLILREENASTYGAGIAWWATGFATTFTDEIISNTDGIDYSNHVDII